MQYVTSTPALDAGGMLRELGRRQARARDVAFAAEVLYFTALACPFRAVVTYWPEREVLAVTVGRLTLATMTAEEARRAQGDSHAAAVLGLRARDAYLDLDALPHPHQLGDQ